MLCCISCWQERAQVKRVFISSNNTWTGFFNYVIIKAQEAACNTDMEEFLFMTLGEKIKKLRVENNWTQEKFAEMMGVSAQAVSRWESLRVPLQHHHSTKRQAALHPHPRLDGWLNSHIVFSLCVPLVTKNQLYFKKIISELLLFAAFNKTFLFIKCVSSIVVA